MAKNNAINIDIVTGGGHTITFPTADTTLVGRDTTDTLTNKKIDPRVQTQTSTSSEPCDIVLVIVAIFILLLYFP